MNQQKRSGKSGGNAGEGDFQVLHKFVLGTKEFDDKGSEFQYDRGWYTITDIVGEERTQLYRSKNAAEAYMKWNVYIGRKKERNNTEERRKQREEIRDGGKESPGRENFGKENSGRVMQERDSQVRENQAGENNSRETQGRENQSRNRENPNRGNSWKNNGRENQSRENQAKDNFNREGEHSRDNFRGPRKNNRGFGRKESEKSNKPDPELQNMEKRGN